MACERNQGCVVPYGLRYEIRRPTCRYPTKTGEIEGRREVQKLEIGANREEGRRVNVL